MCDMNPTSLTPRRTFSHIGWAMFAILGINVLLQALFFYLPGILLDQEGWFSDSSWDLWIGSFAPLYLVAIPCGLLLLKRLPAATPDDHPIGTRNFFLFIPICFFLMYTGSILGTLLSLLFSGGTAQNALEQYLSDNNPLRVLVIVILAPVLEEYVCRKQIIDRTAQYGEKLAVFLSALVFGLLHGNLFQFFYAFALGWVFGYIYIRTGRVRYTIILHSIVNFAGSVVAPWILSTVDVDAIANLDPALPPEEMLAFYQSILPELLLLLGYLLILLGLFVTGMIFLILRSNRLIWKESAAQLPADGSVKTVYGNVGMIVYTLLCLGLTVWALF